MHVDVAEARALAQNTLAAVHIAAREQGAAMAAVAVAEAETWGQIGEALVPTLSLPVLRDAAVVVGEPRLPELLAARDAALAAADDHRDALADAVLDAADLRDITARRVNVDGRLGDVRERMRELRGRNGAAGVLDAAARGQRLRGDQPAFMQQHGELTAATSMLETEAARLATMIARHHRAHRELVNDADGRAAIGDRFLLDARRVVVDRLRAPHAVRPHRADLQDAWHRVTSALARRAVVSLLFESWVRPHGAALIDLEQEADTVSGFETVSYPPKVMLRSNEANIAVDAFRRITAHAMGLQVPVVVDDWWTLLVPGVPRPAPESFVHLALPAIAGLTAPVIARDIGDAPHSNANRASDKLAAAWASLGDGNNDFNVDSGFLFTAELQLHPGATEVFNALPKAPLPFVQGRVSGGLASADFDDVFNEETNVTDSSDILTVNRPVGARPQAIELADLTRPTFLPGSRVGRCVVQGLIGKGGMGEVYKARLEGELGFARSVVLKRLSLNRDEPAALQAFMREAGVAARIAHPNVVQIFDLQTHGGEPFMIMELLEGLSLQKVAARAWRDGLVFDVRVLIRCALDVARGLYAAHIMRRDDGVLVGLVHRDISPDNLFLCHSGCTKLLDFGVARRGDLTTMTGKSELKGKIPYMSPEQILGEPLDGRSDLFSLGATLYWLLCGERPFVGENEMTTLYAVVNKPHLPVSDRRRDAGALGDIVELLLEKNRDDRPASASEVVQRLEAAGPATVEQAAAWLMSVEAL